jgi:hypothetical protein
VVQIKVCEEKKLLLFYFEQLKFEQLKFEQLKFEQLKFEQLKFKQLIPFFILNSQLLKLLLLNILSR